MRQPLPLGTLDEQQLARDLHARHQQQAAAPDPEDLLALLAFIQRQNRHPSRAQRQQDLHDALLLTRVVRNRIDRLELGLMLEGQQAGMTTRELGAPLGITSRAGAGDRIESLRRKARAAALHLRPADIRGLHLEEEPASEGLHEVARQLLAHIDEFQLPEDCLVWAEGIELILRSEVHNSHRDGSIRAQLRALLEDIDEAAEARGGLPSGLPAAARQALAAARTCSTRRAAACPS